MFHAYQELVLHSPYLMMAVVASLGLSIASFYTTFIGMTDFTPWPIAALITMGVQLLLLITSWSIGFEMVKKGKASLVDSGIFVICLTVSVFFSFSALFDAIFDQDLQERTRMTRIHGTVERSIDDLENISRERRSELVGRLLESDAYASWRKTVLEVSDAAAGSEDRLRQVLRDRVEQGRAEIQAFQRSVSNTAGEKERLIARVASNTSEQDLLKQRRQALSSTLSGLQTQLAEAGLAVRNKQTELEIEEKGGGLEGRRKSGRGPVWRRLNKEYVILAEQAKGVQRELNSIRGAVADVDERIQEVARQLAEDQSALANFDAEMDRRRQELEQAKKRLLTSGMDDLSNAASLVQSLRDALSRFDRESDLGAFDQAALLCADVLKEMNNLPQLRDLVTGLSCDRAGMAGLIAPIDQSSRDRDTLTQECVTGGAGARSVNAMDFEQAVEFGRRCIGIAGLPSAKVEYLREEIARLEREESPQASQFTKTSNALLAGEKLAYFALAIALAMDLLVLFTGIMGARTTRSKLVEGLNVNLDPMSHDSPEAMALKALLRHSEMVDDGVKKGRYEAQIDLDDIEPGQGRANAKLALMGMLGEYVDEYPGRPGVYLLKLGTQVELRRELKQIAEQDDFMYGRRGRASASPAMESAADTGAETSPYQAALADRKNDFFVYGDNTGLESGRRRKVQHPGFGMGAAAAGIGGAAAGAGSGAGSGGAADGPGTEGYDSSSQVQAGTVEEQVAADDEDYDPMKMLEENMGG
jgi:hypothetical protein